MRRMQESLVLEAKSAKGGLPKSLWETYSAFCNTNGGRIILGAIEDKKTRKISIEGLEDPNKMLKQFWDIVNDSSKVSYCCLKDSDVQVLESNGKCYIVINVPQVPREFRPVYINGNVNSGTFKRNHEGDYHCTKYEIRSMISESSEKSPDSTTIDADWEAVISQDTIRRYLDALRSFRPNHPLLNTDTEQFLIETGAALKMGGVLKLTMAGLLMFGRNMSIVLECPDYFLDYREVSSSARWDYRLFSGSGDWSGNIFDFLNEVEGRLIKHFGSRFEMASMNQTMPKSYGLSREAVVNAVVHADYRGRCGISIVLEGDHLEITNPGNMRVPFSKAIRGGASDPRNSIIVRMLMLIGYVERTGYGVRAMSDANDSGLLYDFMMAEENDPPLVRTILGFTKSKEDGTVTDADIIMSMMENDSKVTIAKIREITGMSATKISIEIEHLKRKGMIERVGGTRGEWVVHR